jgi:hypothetical protein
MYILVHIRTGSGPCLIDARSPEILRREFPHVEVIGA